MVVGTVPCWLVEFGHLIYSRGLSGVLIPVRHQEQQVIHRLSLAVLCMALAGSLLMAIDSNDDITNIGNKQALTTRTSTFSNMRLAFGRTLAVCWPVVVAMLMFVIAHVYSQTYRDVFGDMVADGDGVSYFDTSEHSLNTLFRMFAGAVWYTVIHPLLLCSDLPSLCACRLC